MAVLALSPLSRRTALQLAGAAVATKAITSAAADKPVKADPRSFGFRVRTVTAGVQLKSAADLQPVEAALRFLAAAKQRFVDAGYEVQTTRVACNGFLLDVPAKARDAALPQLQALDKLAADSGAVLSIGPVHGPAQARGEHHEGLGEWAGLLVSTTRAMSFSVAVATADNGISRGAIRAAADCILALSKALPGGVGNFKFAAAANIPAGTPFFPVAHHAGAPAFAVGLETPNLLREAIGGSADMEQAMTRLQTLLNERFKPVEQLANTCASELKRQYLGIDTSPAPGADSSIGGAIEALTGVPFGSPSTLQACAAITQVLKSLQVSTCGYSGLMLPVLEDAVLAASAAEGRITLSELLLFSSVCGTGLDVVPIPGDVSRAQLEAVIGDVAAMSTRLRKPLSARLFAMPGKAAGDAISFTDPLLFATKVMPVAR